MVFLPFFAATMTLLATAAANATSLANVLNPPVNQFEEWKVQYDHACDDDA
jgi:hypothetical protein